MKAQFLIKRVLIALIMIVIPMSIFAQGLGSISGKVTDKQTGETVIGAGVKISGTNKGIMTDVDGRYILRDLTPGTYTLEVLYIGYSTKQITDVIVKAGVSTPVDVIIEESGQQLETVVITATARQESVSTLYNRQRTNINVSDGISADQIRRSPDRNASEVLKRVSGTSVQDNKFIIVRGLSDRYNATLLNNAILPSSEPDRKAFSFDIIPSNMVDNIVINKTASADLPGDFSGGVIQVLTKDIPTENHIYASVGTGYNTQSTFKDFKLGDKASVENFGYVNKARHIPAGIVSTANYQVLSDREKIASGKLFANSFNLHNSTAAPTQAYQLSAGLRKEFKNNSTLGMILSLNYRNAENITSGIRSDYAQDKKEFTFADNTYKFSSSLGGLANIAYTHGNNKIAFKNIYNITLDNTYLEREGDIFIDKIKRKGYSFDLVSKSLLNSQLEGEHKLSFKDLKLNWNVGYSYSDRLQPDLKSINYDLVEGQTEYVAVVPNGTAARTDASRFFSELFEDSFNGGLNITVPVTFLKEKSSFKLGALKQYKVRDFGARKFGYIRSFATGQFNQNLLRLPFNKIFDPINLNDNGFVLDEGTEPTDRYDATSDLNAGYLMFDTKVAKNLRVSLGARIEDSFQEINTADNSGNRLKVTNQFTDILPSINTIYNFSDKQNLRLSVSNTVTRPELRELSNFGFFDYISKRVLIGNPDLKRSQNTNLDLKYEVFPGGGQILSVSGYYKYFKNPIEQVVSSGSVRNVTFQNAESAKTYGLEIEARKNLGFLNKESILENFTAYLNASVIFSTVNLNSLISEVTNRALQGQSPYLVNAGIMFNDPKSNLSFNLLYNRIGERIAEVGYQGYADIYEKGRNMFDLQVAKRVMKNKGELRLNLSDILNEEILFYQNNNASKTYQKSDNIMNTARTGFGASLTFSYNFSLGNK